jgi:hypothetical protein
MQLSLYLGNDLIDSVSIDPAKITLPGNLGSYTRRLKAQYCQLIRQSGLEPECIVLYRENNIDHHKRRLSAAYTSPSLPEGKKKNRTF